MKDLNDFWSLFLEVWKEGIFGIDVGKFAVAILILLVAIFIRKFFAQLVIGRVKKIVKTTKTRFDDAVVEAFDGPIKFIPIVIGFFFASNFLVIDGIAMTVIENVNRSLIIVMIFWFFYKSIEPFNFVFKRMEKVLTTTLVNWTVKALKFFIFFVGLASVLEVWGIKVGPIIAGLGLFGVAVAFGAQDLFKNLISGIMILIERRFKIGDVIQVDGVIRGVVEQIGFRSTLVRRFDKSPVMVPNYVFTENSVINFTERTYRRIYWNIGVEYRTTVEQLRIIRDEIEKYISSNTSFVPATEVETFVRIDSFSDSSIDILLYCFTKTTDWGEWLEIKERLAFRVKDIVEQAGTGFAFPSQSLYIEKSADGQPEIFVPPLKKN